MTMTSGSRVEWVDHAKGLCIILVVMMQATLDYGHSVGQTGWLHHVVAFTSPFRMPDFFLLSGLFLARSINSGWREYIDRKLIHFAYFYLLWLTIQLVITEGELLVIDPLLFAGAFFTALVDPINSLWFVHMLAIFYIVTRLVRHVPKLAIFAAAVLLQLAFQSELINTNYSVPNRFFDHYIYFFTGYAVAPWIFAFAENMRKHRGTAIAGLVGWSAINLAMVVSGLADSVGLGLLLGFAGAAAIVALGSLLAGSNWAEWLRYAGANSIVIYLTCFFPMKVLTKLLVASDLISNVGWACAFVTFCAVVTPLIFHRVIRDTYLNFLYERPATFRFEPILGDRIAKHRLSP